MPKVIFFLIPDIDETARVRLACKLAARFFDDEQRTHILTQNETLAKEVHETLWEYPPDRFIPHEISDRSLDSCLVTISSKETYEGLTDVCINATQATPTIADRFSHVCELVLGNERPRARDQYREYREKQFELEYQELDDWD